MKAKMGFSRLFLAVIVITGFSILLSGCKKFEPVPAQPGVTCQYTETYDLQKLNHILNEELEVFLLPSTMHLADFQGQLATPKYPVKLYRVTYPTVVPELGNLPTTASGLIAIPDNGRDSMPIISYQHGTVTRKFECPSNPDSSAETRLMIAQFASQGYIVIAPDFIGLGISDQPHADFIRRSAEQSCLDMLKAATQILKEQKIRQGPLFLHGWSQGGWATMTFLRKMESLNMKVKAAATACAAADFFALIDRWVNNPQPDDQPGLSAVIANCICASEYYNSLPGLTASAVRPEYLQATRDFYLWNIDIMSFYTKTTVVIRDFLQPQFMATGNVAGAPFWKILEQDQAYRWRCLTPLRMYYGEADKLIPVYLSTLPAEYQKQLGCGTTAISAGPIADHWAGCVYSLIHVLPWFDGFILKETEMEK